MFRGFSLVEFSVVLVIIGLLTGGILAGQSLIRAAELRATTTEYQRYITATQTFRDKYLAIPGDMREATRFWQLMSATNCTTNVSPAPAVNAANGTCDGNGDGMFLPVAAANSSSEIFQYWRQLALAELIEGAYSGLSGANASGLETSFGTNVPASRLSNAGWAVNRTSTGSGEMFDIDYGNFFYLGASTTTNLASAAIIEPEELWNIDTKMDDGKPGRGRVIARNISTCTTTSDPDTLDADYLLTSSAIGCAVHFIQAF